MTSPVFEAPAIGTYRRCFPLLNVRATAASVRRSHRSVFRCCLASSLLRDAWFAPIEKHAEQYTGCLCIDCLGMAREQLHGYMNLLLLAVLASGPAHGYALSAELRRRSGDTLRIVEGTLYPALHRLEAAGLVASTSEVAEGRRRRVYQITAEGKDVLEEEKNSWKEFQTCIDQVLDQTP